MRGHRAGTRGGARLAALAFALLALGVGSATPALADPPPDFPWPDLLPPLPTASNPQPGPQEGCQKPTMACVDLEIKRMQEAQDRLGCDHRAVFATTYLTLTQALKSTIAADPRFFADPDYFFYEDALFANLYFRTLERGGAGQPVPEAWAIAFQTAAAGDANAAQDMLLGINAHVQRDMPYVLASLGLHRPDGSSRKLDHDRANDVLNHAYNAVVRAIADRYDPMVNTTNPGTPGDNLAGLELVKVWRENVWRNAERLLNATTDQQRRDVESSIETNAADSARSIAAAQGPPGYRATRDAYCQGRLSRPASAPGAAPATRASRRRRHHHRHHRVATRHRRTAHRHAARAQRPPKSELLGHSVQGRPIGVTRVGDPNAPRSVLVFGAIHGEEPAGRAIVARLARRPAPPGSSSGWSRTSTPTAPRTTRGTTRTASTSTATSPSGGATSARRAASTTPARGPSRSPRAGSPASSSSACDPRSRSGTTSLSASSTARAAPTPPSSAATRCAPTCTGDRWPRRRAARRTGRSTCSRGRARSWSSCRRAR